MSIESKDYTEGELRMLMRAVRRALRATTDEGKENGYKALRDTAIHIGLMRG